MKILLCLLALCLVSCQSIYQEVFDRTKMNEHRLCLSYRLDKTCPVGYELVGVVIDSNITEKKICCPENDLLGD